MLNNISDLILKTSQSTDELLLANKSLAYQNISNYPSANDTQKKISEINENIKQAIAFLHSKYGLRLISLIYQEEFEPNISNSVIDLLDNLKTIFPEIYIREWLISVYNHNLNTPIVIRAILYIIIYYPDLFESSGITIALASVSNKSCEIQELSIRVFENYCTKDSYDALCSIKKQDLWLQNYIEKVKKYVINYLCQ